MGVFCCLSSCSFEAIILFCIQSLAQKHIFTFVTVFVCKIRRFYELKVIRTLTVKSDVSPIPVGGGGFFPTLKTFKVLIYEAMFYL